MKKYLFIIAAASMVLAACSKEKELRAINEETTTEGVRLPGWTYISALGGDESSTANPDKARIDNSDATFKWSTGDQIAIWSGETYHVSSPLSSNYNYTNNATFAFEGDLEAGRANFAVYPASLVYNGSAVISSSISNHTATSLKITLPASYTLAEVQGNTSVTPMIAVNTSGSGLEFKSVCALLRINVKYVPKDAAFIKVSFPGKKVQGEFELQNFEAGTDGVLVAAHSENGDETITITDLGISAFTDNLTINIPVPIGKVSDSDYPYVRVAAYDSFGVYSNKINSIDVPIKTVSSAPVVWNPTRLTSRLVEAKLPYFLSQNVSKRKIVFAPGNLQATTTLLPVKRDGTEEQALGEATNWRFAAHQWEAYGDCLSNNLKELGNVDLFAWVGTSATYTGYTDANKYGILPADVSKKTSLCGNVSASEKINSNNDWCNLFNGVTYPANTWRLPDDNGKNSTADEYPDRETTVEFARLLNQRSTTNGYVAAKATIIRENGTAIPDTLARGLIVFPDNFAPLYGFKTLVNYTRQDSSSGQAAKHFSNNILTEEEWNRLENEGGCAFLPVTCIRDRSKVNGSYVASTGIYKEGAYWSGFTVSGSNVSTAIIADAEYCAHSRDGADVTDNPKGPKTNINPAKSVDRSRGCGVRFVRDVN